MLSDKTKTTKELQVGFSDKRSLEGKW